MRSAAERLSVLGAIVREISLPLHQLGFPVWSGIRGDAACVMLLEMNGAGIGCEGLYLPSLMEAASVAKGVSRNRSAGVAISSAWCGRSVL